MTLIEILLVIVILGLISIAIIINFSNLNKIQYLEEGTNRLETVLKMVKAQAVLTGRTLKVSFLNNKISISQSINISTDSISDYVNFSIESIDGIKYFAEDETYAENIQYFYFYANGDTDDFVLNVKSIYKNDKRVGKVDINSITGIKGEIE